MTTPDPFAFVRQALGVEVRWQEPGEGREGYFLDGPHPEWLGDNLAAAIAQARRKIAEAGLDTPRVPMDWPELARRAREALPILSAALDYYVRGVRPGDQDAPFVDEDELP